MSPSATPPGIRLGIVRSVSYGLFGPPDSFVPEIRELGGSLVRVYVYWSQVEPEEGRYDWTVVDALLGQLDPAAETWVTVCSSSPWATRHPTDFLPSSPAKDRERYARFIRELVTRCRGRVEYWQCNNEPSNTGMLWAGTAPEYVEQLTAFAAVVRAADPDAALVLGGCGYDVLASPDGSPARQFFDQVVADGRDSFDLFAVNLYGDPRAVPDQVESVRAMMRRHGYERPVVAGEYNGPILFEFPAAQGVFEATMTAAFGGTIADSGTDSGTDSGLGADPEVSAAPESPDRLTMRALYARAAELPPELRMFLDDCPPDLAAKRDRINRRQLVTRNVLALASGVTRTVCWNLAPEVPGYADPLNLMGFLFGKLALMDYEGRALTARRPSAETFALLADHLEGATSVCRLDHGGRGQRADQEVFAFEVVRDSRPPLHILWSDGDTFTGEDAPPTPVDWPWPHPTAHVTDTFGSHVTAPHDGAAVHLDLSVTPLFLTTAPRT
ncbi:hypothetical protein ACIQNU_18880 [Streptomyces sp. NPDC091292]|uniref:hypothetical protein n=1 Tax=Streptomyces sp. NPDC091292 TaxID=3365991 RepID=UPI003814CF68